MLNIATVYTKGLAIKHDDCMEEYLLIVVVDNWTQCPNVDSFENFVYIIGKHVFLVGNVSLPESNIAPARKAIPRGNFIFQPSIFRFELLVSG